MKPKEITGRQVSKMIQSPIDTGGYRGERRKICRPPPLAQRLSSTAVYPPCPRMSTSSSDGCAFGHGRYTASGYMPGPGSVQTDAGSGAFGSVAGNVTLTAGRDITG